MNPVFAVEPDGSDYKAQEIRHRHCHPNSPQADISRQEVKSGNKKDELAGQGGKHGILDIGKPLKGGNKDNGRSDKDESGTKYSHSRNSDRQQVGTVIENTDHLGGEYLQK